MPSPRAFFSRCGLFCCSFRWKSMKRLRLQSAKIFSMNLPNGASRLANIRLHPIKSLDPVAVREARIGPSGGLEFDRAWALYSADGQWVNGKRTAAIHLIRAAFAPDVSSVTLSVPGDSRKTPTKTSAFPGDTAAASQWFSK